MELNVRPVPIPDPVTQILWDSAKEGRLSIQGFEGTDTSSCIEKYTDEQVRTFPGDEANLKVTYAHDVAVAGHLLSRR